MAAVNQTSGIITLDNAITSPLQLSALGNLATNPVYLRSREFRITVSLYQQPSVAVPSRNTQVIQTETFRNLSMDPRHSQYFQTRDRRDQRPAAAVGRSAGQGTSWLIRMQDDAPNQAGLAAAPARAGAADRRAAERADNARRSTSWTTADDGIARRRRRDVYRRGQRRPQDRTGIFALLNVPQISIVAIPGQGTRDDPVGADRASAKTLSIRFAVLDPQYPDSAIADIQAQRQAFDTKYAAIYYPWLTIPDPIPTNLGARAGLPVAAKSGHVVGIYAATDDSRGVFKAPANEVVQGITGLTATLVQGDQDVLNPCAEEHQRHPRLPPAAAAASGCGARGS